MQKLKIKDYNKELEEILANKTYSKDTKNLLSSMLYKIENSYDDYKKVKVEVASKKELLEELIQIIQEDCKEIEIIKPNLKEENKILNGKKSIVIKKEQKIITYQNELALLKAIYELSTKKLKNDNENINERALFNTLNDGKIEYKSEIIRDFDGWSWNIMTKEIENYIPNLVYQSLVYLLGYNNLNEKNDIKTIIKEKYKSSISQKLLEQLYKLVILDYINKYPQEKSELEEIEENLAKELSKMSDNKKYIEEITRQKKKYIKEIEEIDKYINDDLKLKKEYIKQNEKLPQEERVFSLSDFSEKMQERRSFLESEIKILTEKLKPKNYVKEKNRIEKELSVVKEIKTADINNLTKEFVEVVLKAIDSQIEQIELKKEIIEKIYTLRYLKLIIIDNEKTAGDLCKKQFEKTEKHLITIACNLKVINIFSQNVEENYKIYKNIFNTKIIDLESAYIEIGKDNIVKIYDENSLEKEEQFTEFKELTVRYNKKTKIFL